MAIQKRSPKGRGTIFESSGKYVFEHTVRVYDRTTESTVAKKVREVFSTRKDALKAQETLISDKSLGKPVVYTNEKTGAYLRRWLDTVKSTRTKGTWESYNRTLWKFVIPYFENIPLRVLTPDHLQTFYNKLVQEGASPHKVKSIHTMLSTAFKAANISINPTTKTVRPKVHKKSKDWWTLEELLRFKDAVSLQQFTNDRLFHFLLLSGLRQNEAWGLRVEDVVWSGNYIKIRRGISWVGQELVTNDFTKTDTGMRDVYLPTDAMELLRTSTIDGWLFRTSNNTVPRRNGINESLAQTCVRAGVKVCSIHHLRHMYASLCALKGLQMEFVAKQLGHANALKMTVEIYTHFLGDRKEQAQKLNAL